MLLKRTEQGCVFTLLKHVRSVELPPMLPIAGISRVRTGPRLRSGLGRRGALGRSRAGRRLRKARRV